MKLNFIAASPKVGPMRKTIGLADGTNRSYPMAYKLTSCEEDFDPIAGGVLGYRELLANHAKLGHALYKGMFTRPLVNESRRGLTDKDSKTEFLVLDIDGFEHDDIKAGACTRQSVINMAEKIIALLPESLHDVSYVALASSSFGLRDKELSVHIHFLLSDPVESRAMKDWLVSLNFTQIGIYEKLHLTPSRMRIKSIVDPCLAEPARVVYISPPEFGPKVKNPFNDNKDRIVAVEKSNPLLDLRAELNGLVKKEGIIVSQREEKLKDLQRKAGVDTKKLASTRIKTRDGSSVTVITNPPNSRLEFAYADNEFARYNIAGKTNNAYWVRLDNPEIVHCFVPDEPAFMFKKADPEAYERHVSKFGEAYESVKDEERGLDRRITRNMYIDQSCDAYITVEHDIENDEIHELKERKSYLIAKEWMRHYGQMAPDPVPAIHVVSDPNEDKVVYMQGDKQFLNRFEPTKYMRDPTPFKFANEPRFGSAWLLHLDCPVIAEIILNMLGDDMECFEHFVNWIAFIYQTKSKAETAWLVHGAEGTGKGLFFKRVLRVLFGDKYAAQNTLQGIADDQFNGWMEDLIMLNVDEFNMKGSNSLTKTASLLKNFITEPTMMLRKMNQQQRPVYQRLNFIFATNDLDALPVNDSRRYNIAPRQLRDLEARLPYIKEYRDETDVLIEQELVMFSRYLTSFVCNKRMVSTILRNQARLDAQAAGMSASDRFFENLRDGNFEAFAGLLDKPTANLDMNERMKVESVKRFITANLPEVNTNKACYLHKDDLRALYSYLAGKEVSENAFGRMMGTHEITIKRRNNPVGIPNKLETRPQCVEVTWQYSDTKVLEILRKSNRTVQGKNVTTLRPNDEDEEARKARLIDEATYNLDQK